MSGEEIDPLDENAVLDGFDRLWQESEIPDLKAFLDSLSSRISPKILAKLIDLDRRNRVNTGHRVDLGSYLSLAESDAETEIIETEVRKWDRAGEVIADKYRILERLGEGGFGKVYLAADRSGTDDRKVAIKILQSAKREPKVRFEAEKAAMGRMGHPNIALFHDHGIAETGQPYFVMEYIKGKPVTEFCEETPAGLRQRLSLIVDLCRAVQHAHFNGVIHRDIKPTNVMVTDIEGVPTLKLIDFGLVKPISGRLTPDTIHTLEGTTLGTVAYMSPQQLASEEVDTRTDVFAIGVLTYELLTGSTPVRSELFQTQPADAYQKLSSCEFELPSLRLAEESKSADSITLGDNLQDISAELKRDLDWIIMQALRKDPDQRYQTADAMAEDLLRYLNDQPVIARPESFSYRFEKYYRKNRSLVLTGLAGVIGLLIATVVASTFAYEASLAVDEKTKAIEAKDDALAVAKDAEEQANIARLSTDRVFDFLSDVLGTQGPVVRDSFSSRKLTSWNPPRGVNMRLLDVLKAAIPQIRPRFESQPSEELRVRLVIARTLSDIGAFETANEQFEVALSSAESLFAIDSILARRCYVAAGDCFLLQGRTEAATRLFEKARRGLTSRDPKPETKETLSALVGLAQLAQQQGDYQGAIKRCDAFEDGVQPLTPRPHGLISLVALVRASAQESLGEFKEAERLLKQALAGQLSFTGPLHPDSVAIQQSLVELYRKDDKLDEAEQVLEELSKSAALLFSETHPSSLSIANTRALLLYESGQAQEAIAVLEKCRTTAIAEYGAGFPNVLSMTNNLATMYLDADRSIDALPLFVELLRRRRIDPGTDHPDTAITMFNLARAYQENNESAKAVDLFEEVRPLIKKYHDIRDFWPQVRFALASAYKDAKRWSDALPLLEEQYDLRIKESGEKNPNALLNGLFLNYARVETDRFEEADEPSMRLLELADEIASKSILFSRASLIRGRVLLGLKRYEDAKAPLLQAYERMKGKQAIPMVPGSAEDAVTALVQLYEATNDETAAAEWRKELETAPAGK